MPRRKSINMIRDIGVDPRYQSENIQKFINIIMLRGKKNTARSLVYSAFDIIEKKMNAGAEFSVVSFFDKAVEAATPLIEVRSRRVGGSVYQVPVEVKTRRGRSLALKAIKKGANSREGARSFDIKLAAEIIDAVEGKGGAAKARQEKHKMAEANRAFSHYAW
jgi:small subunit ribosomal protein S7